MLEEKPTAEKPTTGWLIKQIIRQLKGVLNAVERWAKYQYPDDL